MTQEEFVKRANLKHFNKYNYSNVVYLNSKSKVKIICFIHGEFEQVANSHLLGRGCKKCGSKQTKTKKKKSLESFILDAHKVHNFKYDYSNVEYINNKSKVKIICKTHGVFEQRPDNHLQGNGCLKCYIKNNYDYITVANKIHGFKYNYSNTEYTGSHKKVKIICNTHGTFEQRANSHLQGNGCPLCMESKGEIRIAKWLQDNKIIYIREKCFSECKNKSFLYFDFYLVNYNLCIEYDGEQHYIPIKAWGGEKYLKKIKKNDKIKNQFCSLNNMKLVRISYQDFDNLEQILNNIIYGENNVNV